MVKFLIIIIMSSLPFYPFFMLYTVFGKAKGREGTGRERGRGKRGERRGKRKDKGESGPLTLSHIEGKEF